jgi:copper chaperone CopZ
MIHESDFSINICYDKVKENMETTYGSGTVTNENVNVNDNYPNRTQDTDTSKVGRSASKRLPVSTLAQRTPLAKVDTNVVATSPLKASIAMSKPKSAMKPTSQGNKTPTKNTSFIGASSASKTLVNSSKKSVAVFEDREHQKHSRNMLDSASAGTPVRALNESLFEVVVESPRDVKIRELTQVVKTFKQDARYIRDIYSEEIENLRFELSQQKKMHDQTDVSADGACTTKSSEENNVSPGFGVSNANSIISEAESIIALAEAMLQANRPSHTPRSSAAKVDLAAIQTRETELLRLKEEVFIMNSQRTKDQQRMHEMEIVMRGMALKLEEYSRSQSHNNVGTDENWTTKVLSFFS